MYIPTCDICGASQWEGWCTKPECMHAQPKFNAMVEEINALGRKISKLNDEILFYIDSVKDDKTLDSAKLNKLFNASVMYDKADNVEHFWLQQWAQRCLITDAQALFWDRDAVINSHTIRGRLENLKESIRNYREKYEYSSKDEKNRTPDEVIQRIIREECHVP